MSTFAECILTGKKYLVHKPSLPALLPGGFLLRPIPRFRARTLPALARFALHLQRIPDFFPGGLPDFGQLRLRKGGA